MRHTEALILIAQHCKKIELGGDNDGLYFTFDKDLGEEQALAFIKAIKNAYENPAKHIVFGHPSFDRTPETTGFEFDDEWKENGSTIVRFRIGEGKPRVRTPLDEPVFNAPEEVAAEAVWKQIPAMLKGLHITTKMKCVDHRPKRRDPETERADGSYLFG